MIYSKEDVIRILDEIRQALVDCLDHSDESLETLGELLDQIQEKL